MRDAPFLTAAYVAFRLTPSGAAGRIAPAGLTDVRFRLG